MKQAVRDTEGVELLCDSELCILALTSKHFPVSRLAKALGDRGWSTFTAQNPSCLTLCLGDQHTHIWRQWVTDLRESVQQLMHQKGSSKEPAVEHEIKGPYSAVQMQMTTERKKAMEERLRDYIENNMKVPVAKL